MVQDYTVSRALEFMHFTTCLILVKVDGKLGLRFVIFLHLNNRTFYAMFKEVSPEALLV